MNYSTAKVIYLTLLLIFLLFQNSITLYSFSSGPYTHERISRIALDEYALRSGWEVSFECAQQIIHSSLMSDGGTYRNDLGYHCLYDNFIGCSWRLEQLKRDANQSATSIVSFQKIGQALHLVHDFYAHTNWVEKFQTSLLLAPLEAFNYLLPPPWLQSGKLPASEAELRLSVECFKVPEDEWDEYIEGIHHECINKDTELSFPRGMTHSKFAGMSYHELAARYAIRHSVKLFEYFAATSLHFKTCLRPRVGGCHGYCNRAIERQY